MGLFSNKDKLKSGKLRKSKFISTSSPDLTRFDSNNLQETHLLVDSSIKGEKQRNLILQQQLLQLSDVTTKAYDEVWQLKRENDYLKSKQRLTMSSVGTMTTTNSMMTSRSIRTKNTSVHSISYDQLHDKQMLMKDMTIRQQSLDMQHLQSKITDLELQLQERDSVSEGIEILMRDNTIRQQSIEIQNLQSKISQLEYELHNRNHELHNRDIKVGQLQKEKAQLLQQIETQLTQMYHIQDQILTEQATRLQNYQQLVRQLQKNSQLTI